MATRAKATPAGAATSALSTYLRETAGPLGAAALTLPLLVLYGAGAVLAPEVRNGADLISDAIAAALAAADQPGPLPVLLVYGALALIQLGIALYLGRRGQLSTRWLLPFGLECCVYAVATGLVASYATAGVIDSLTQLPAPQLAAATALAPLAPLAPLAQGATGAGVVDNVLLSFGAGFHEELVFRLAGIAGIGRLLLGPSWRAAHAAVLALLLASALLFSAAHHIVEPFAAPVFIFRSAMGLLFGALFLLRGFAVAAWTHALYDIWVLSMSPNA